MSGQFAEEQGRADTPHYRTVLIGAGVVGRAIALEHLRHRLPVEIVDASAASLGAAAEMLDRYGFEVTDAGPFETGMDRILVCPVDSESTTEYAADATLRADELLVIESIVERRDVKRQLIEQVSRCFGSAAVVATNTSSLRLSDLEDASQHPDCFCGMHFFMPVTGRDLVEVVRTARTGDAAIVRVCQHAARLGKQTLTVADSPGFVVNRMLAPYLNQSMLMLGTGADHRRVRAAALRFGMPMSPLELVDMIGTRTAFDAGRAAWQAFPDRIDPAPILPGMIKAGLAGRASGAGFYHYTPTGPAPTDPERLTDEATRVLGRYQRDPRAWSEEEILSHLAVPMLIESACVLRDSVVSTIEAIELAMRGGLGFTAEAGFFASMDRIGRGEILKVIRAAGTRDHALRAPQPLVDALETHATTAEAVMAFGKSPD